MKSIFRVTAQKRSIRRITTLCSHRLCNASCVVVGIPSNGDRVEELELKEAERDIARTLATDEAKRRFISGRVALRRAVGDAFDLPAVLKGAQGAPVLPHNVLGSISHKDKYAAAIAAVSAAAADGQQSVIESLGVDLELAASSKHLIGRRILTDNEKAWNRTLPPHVCDVKLRFSIKEALYKALFRHIPRHIGFKEVEVFPGERDDEASVKLLLPDPVAAKLHVTAQWKLVLQDQYILSAVSVRRHD